MELRQLETLSVIAEEGSFSRAAARLRITQPAISQQIAKLEEELGVSLLDRMAGGVRLTGAGEILVEKARTVTEHLRDVRRRISDLDEELTGTLTVGAIPTIAPYLLPKVIKAFHCEHPRLRVQVIEDVTEAILRLSRSGSLDLAILSAFPETPAIHAELIGAEPLHLILPRQHRLAKTEGDVSLSEIDGEPFLALHDVHCMAAQVARFCHRARSHPSVVVRSSQLETICAMVSAGCGVSIVPDMMCRPGARRTFVCRAIRNDPRPSRPIMAAWSLLRYRPRSARAFLQAVKAALVSEPLCPQR